MARQEELAVGEFTGLLRWLDAEGIPYVIIGGCAVGACARTRDHTVFAADLDIDTTSEALDEMLARAPE